MVTEEIKKGYKQTEVGVIPEDWNLLTFDKLASIRKSTFNPKKSSEPIFCIELENIEQGSGNLLGNSETSQNSSIKVIFHKNDVLFGRLRAYLKKFWLAKRDGVASTEIWPLISNLEIITPSYLFHLVQTNRFLNAASEAYGTHMPRTDWNVIKNVIFPIPPTKDEQEAVVHILHDTDTLIECLGKLIAKKKNIKKGAMQELLTGKTRLPGFEKKKGYKQTEIGLIPEDWTYTSLRRVLSQSATYGIVKAGVFQKNGIPMIRGGDIKDGKIIDKDLPLVSNEKSKEYERTIIHHNDAVIGLVGYPGESSVVPQALEGANISRAVGLLRPTKELISQYLVYYLNSPKGRKEFLKPGAGSAQFVVNLKDLNELKLPLPGIKEQTAIATVLSDMDTEIETLKNILLKYRQIKQGMMQQLLTGRIRLKCH